MRKRITFVRHVGDNVSPLDLLILEGRIPNWADMFPEVIRYIAGISGDSVYGVIVHRYHHIGIGIAIGAVADCDWIMTGFVVVSVVSQGGKSDQAHNEAYHTECCKFSQHVSPTFY